MGNTIHRQQFVKLCECGCDQPTLVATRTRGEYGTIKGQPLRFVFGHHLRGQARPVAERFWEKVNKNSDRSYNGTLCWEWLASKDQGYGQFGMEHGRNVAAHRLAYEFLRGPIPEGLTLDHLCRNTSCVNPNHLEPTPSVVNILRGDSPPAINARRTHCQHGHPFDQTNTLVRPNGRRVCRACRRTREKARRGVVATEVAA